MKQCKKILDKQRYSVGSGKLRTPILETISDQIISCLETYSICPDIIIGTDSRRSSSMNYTYSPSVSLMLKQGLRNVLTKIYFTKFARRYIFMPSPDREQPIFRDFQTKRLITEGKMTIAISEALYHLLIDLDIPHTPLQIHLDYNTNEKFGSHTAYEGIQAYIAEIDFPHQISFKPDAYAASKGADKILRTA